MTKFIRCGNFLVDPGKIYSIQANDGVLMVELIDPDKVEDAVSLGHPETNTLMVQYQDLLDSDPFFRQFHETFLNFVQLPNIVATLPHLEDAKPGLGSKGLVRGYTRK